jgi:CRISPR-associated protein Csx1
MSKKIILQIGRLDKNIEQDIKFKFHDKEYKYPLSSLALKEHSGKDNTKVILFYPVSLVLNEQYKNTIESHNNEYNSFFQQVSEIVNDESKQKEYLKNPEKIFLEHPHSKLADETFILNSLGKYLNNELKTNLHNIIIHIWAILIKEYIENSFNEIYIDISSGLNFYITALMEALRFFLVWAKLCNIEDNNNIVKGYICYTDPILGRSEQAINMYIYELSYKVFFTSPIAYQELDGLVKNVIEDGLNLDRKTKAYVREHLESFLKIFSCFENAAPLYLYMNDFQNSNDITQTIKEITNEILKKYIGNWYSSPEFNFNKFSKILNAFAFFTGLKKLIEHENINNQGYVKLDCLKNFSKILSKLNLHSQASILDTELYNNFQHSDFNKNI